MNIAKAWFKQKFATNELEWKPQILVKLRLRELCDSELP